MMSPLQYRGDILAEFSAADRTTEGSNGDMRGN